MTTAVERAVLRELDRAHPSPVTRRSLRSLVVAADHSRSDVREALAALEGDGRIERSKESGLLRYRLVDGPTDA
jgi:DNA-binding GntR family transcriptional regulator